MHHRQIRFLLSPSNIHNGRIKLASLTIAQEEKKENGRTNWSEFLAGQIFGRQNGIFGRQNGRNFWPECGVWSVEVE